MGLLPAIFLILFTLKVAGLTTISWWIVVSPLLALLVLTVLLVWGGFELSKPTWQHRSRRKWH